MNTNFAISRHVNDPEELFSAQAVRDAVERIGGFRSHCSEAFTVNSDVPPSRMLECLQSHLREMLFLRHSTGGNSIEAVALLDDSTLLVLYLQRGHVTAEVSSKWSEAQKRFEPVLEILSKYKANPKQEGGAWVDFTHQHADNVSRHTQFLRCPSWAEIEGNYPSGVRGKLQSLIEIKDPSAFGRLMIWHGAPGTGKTFAIRALMMAWKDRYDFVVVTDPENLAANPSYYYDVASSPSKSHGRNGPDDEAQAGEADPRRVLFILEDSADLIIKESRSAHYDKVNKLLNITDGLIGQGREDLFLITFNEDLQDIDPAFLRPGRCFARLEFGKLDARDSSTWLMNHGAKIDTEESEYTLAQLYSKIGRQETKVDLLAEVEPVVGGFSKR